MESEGVRRRMKMIASHFALASTNTIPPTTNHLLPMNCSGSFDTLTPRRHNTLYFARQDSASQAFFMKQGKPEKQVSCVPSKCPPAPNHKSNEEQQPLFARPTNMNSNPPSSANIGSNISNLPDHPSFARPNTATTTKNLSYSSQLDGIKRTPRMDVVDFRKEYVVTVELAGVNVNDIRVEVHDQNLMIKGKRPTQSWRVYQRKEILKGSFNIVWPLPFDANVDTISADFQDGSLRVNIPKL